MQQWFAYFDPAMEEALHDIPLLRSFAGLDATVEAVPDETTILKFRHLLERHGLATAMLEEINALLGERGLILRQGTMVDATLVAAPTSTKNRDGKRDPEMSSTKKGNQWRRPGEELPVWKREINQRLSQLRTRVEHPFRVVKRQFGFTKMRYRGLAKNTAQLTTLVALSNLYLVRRQLLEVAG